jgi:S-adenosylmethionine synthetase
VEVFSMNNAYILTSESVTEGHPDKVCDYIADSILDACISGDPASRVACEVLCKENNVILAGEITTAAPVNFETVAREAIREVGYTDPSMPFCWDKVKIVSLITRQSPDIALGVNQETSKSGDQGAGDQGMMFGYATNETPELMPLPILMAHRLALGLAEDRKSGRIRWLRPDGKSQVSVLYENGKPKKITDVVVSTHHAGEVGQPEIRKYVLTDLAPRILGDWFHQDIRFFVNPTGSFVVGGPSADCGVTGRKIIVDTYGGAAHHGGGAFSGKDPSKVDRSAAYFCRYAAREAVKKGLADRVEIQVSYAIGMADPVSIKVDSFGTGDNGRAEAFVKTFNFRPASMIRTLGLIRPIYRMTTNYGHFGRKGLPWES